MGTYRSVGKNGKVSDNAQGRDKPKEGGGSRYREDTPSFESLKSGNAGRGVQGDKSYTVGQQEYKRPSMSKKWTEK